MKRYEVINYKTIGKKRFSIGYVALLAVVILVAIRFFLVINNNSERGSLPYVQLLNFSMPIVETQAYDEGVYMENKLDLKEVVIETLGLKNISTYGIISNEVSFFKNIKINSNFNITETVSNSILPFFSPFEVNENSIIKVTEEDLAQLSQVSEAYDPNLKAILEPLNHKVLIYQTHSQEGYFESKTSPEDDRFRSQNEDINVTGVSDVLAKELEEGYGVTVIHDETIHDNNYNLCYDMSAETLQRYLSEYGDFDLIIDFHRDDAKDRASVVANINGQNLARMMFVTAENSTNLEANTSLANELGDISDNLFPGLVRDKRILQYSPGGINGFNMSFSEKSVVWEVGTTMNTSVEAKLTSKYIARIIAEYLKDK
ncbi:MAG: stage II sporulation protein P [Peptostreptococcaceae bacterium]